MCVEIEPRFTRLAADMRNCQILLLVFNTILLGGCAIAASDSLQQTSLMTGASVVPRESVAAERCPESYLMRDSRQGAFHRTIQC